MERHETVIIGGGQAGLALSYLLRQRGQDHVMIERGRLGGRWHDERWDSLHYQFPNWALRLPGFSYVGTDPEGFSHYSKVVDFLAGYAAMVDPPALLGVNVERVSRAADGRLRLETSSGAMSAGNIVVAAGAFPSPRIPAFAGQISPEIAQLHSSAYRNPSDLPPGAVLVIGSGSSGGQIAEELHDHGRNTFLSVSRHRKFPRRLFGKDMLWWLYELGLIDRTIDSFADRRPPPAILVTGIDGGHDLDLCKLAHEGMILLGRALDADGDAIFLADNLSELLAESDASCEKFRTAAIEHARRHGMGTDEPAPAYAEPPPGGVRLDLKAAGITSIIWCTGYWPAFDWIDIPVFDADAAPLQERGVTACPGLYFLGLHWMHSLKSGALFGVGEDAEFIAGRIVGSRPTRLGD
jgi:putative flavoprotein involved in K+ transport